MLLTVDGSNVISSVSGDVERLLGYRAEELVGTDADALWGCATSAPAWGVQSATCRTKDGGLWKTYRRSAPFYASDGRTMGSMELLADMLRASATQQPELEGQLRSQKLEALGTLASGIAHDFNNLLQAIQGHAALALDVLPASFPIHANLEHVIQASVRGAELVRRILAFGRPEEHARQTVDLGQVTGEAVALLRATLPTAITLCTRVARERLSVLALPMQLHQIVINLATNAAHAIGARPGVIEIRVDAMDLGEELSDRLGLSVGPHIVLSVRDDGCGMPASVRARIFDPFFTTKDRDRGTGLGLSVVHGIVSSAGGAIDVESSEGVGTTFRIYFPRVAELEPERGGETFPEGRGQRVLYVDDDPILVTLGKSVLESIGYRVTACEGSVRALEAFTAGPDQFDIVLSDVSMPVLSGFELTRRICELRKDIPVLVMSGYVGPEERAQTSRVGAREILLKPVSMSEFGSALARNLPANCAGGSQHTAAGT